MSAAFLALGLLASLTSGAGPVEKAEVEAPRVHLRAPRPGWTHQRVITVQGTVSDKRITMARVALNNLELPINVHGGRFEVKLVIPPGEVTIEVSARGAGGIGRDAVTFYAEVPPTDLLVILSWDSAGTDLDLHVTDPTGEEGESDTRSASGGALEVDDTDGYGPEIFAQPHALAGSYRVAVASYDVGSAPQTNAEVLVVIRQGTPAERRVRFHVTFTREDENIEVGSFRVDPAER